MLRITRCAETRASQGANGKKKKKKRYRGGKLQRRLEHAKTRPPNQRHFTSNVKNTHKRVCTSSHEANEISKPQALEVVTRLDPLKSLLSLRSTRCYHCDLHPHIPPLDAKVRRFKLQARISPAYTRSQSTTTRLQQVKASSPSLPQISPPFLRSLPNQLNVTYPAL